VTRLATTLKDQRRQVAMQTIASAALQLFAERGFAATSVDDIATAAGCSPRTFYRYFATKEDVMFHDLPEMLTVLRETVVAHLDGGMSPWEATAESLIALIGRFDIESPRVATERMALWMSEPSLRTRYVQYVNEAEQVVADALDGSRGDVDSALAAALIAVTAIGTYRVSIFTHQPDGREKLAGHLRELLATAGAGLGDADKVAR
jgi:AcrR family transcriptional regulator